MKNESIIVVGIAALALWMYRKSRPAWHDVKAADGTVQRVLNGTAENAIAHGAAITLGDATKLTFPDLRVQFYADAACQNPAGPLSTVDYGPPAPEVPAIVPAGQGPGPWASGYGAPGPTPAAPPDYGPPLPPQFSYTGVSSDQPAARAVTAQSYNDAPVSANASYN